MSNKISELKNAIGAGARPNKYRINFSIPAAVPTVSDLSTANILCKAASFPAMSIGVIEVFNQGRKLPLPGDTTFENSWSLTFYQTEDHSLRRDMIAWMHSADDFQRNAHSGNPNSILGELSVEQLDSAGNGTVKYTFHNVFVSSVDEVSLTDDPDGNVQEFSVTFTFSDWVVGEDNVNKPAVSGTPTRNNTTYEA